MPADLATQIREARDAVGQTQEALAAAVGVSQKTVSAWETGVSVPRTLDTWRRLAAALGVAVAIDATGTRLVRGVTRVDKA
jgi:transcriptional regulator with XRE-family HTH domain